KPAAPTGKSSQANAVPPKPAAASARPQPSAPAPAVVPPVSVATPAQNDWAGIVATLNLRGIAQQLAANCSLQKREDDAIYLMLDAAHSQLHSKQQEERLQQALQEHFGTPLRLVLQVGAPENETPAQRQAREAAERQQAAQQAIEQDPGVRALQDAFNARIQPDTVRPVD
ncbi:MAG: DNA polymerase III subunit gamma/tau, partial [Methylococcaceae bacterium]|nr:DNA polymerase III subunit gamma/tau [Methylococcaceae bacterium]